MGALFWQNLDTGNPVAIRNSNLVPGHWGNVVTAKLSQVQCSSVNTASCETGFILLTSAVGNRWTWGNVDLQCDKLCQNPFFICLVYHKIWTYRLLEACFPQGCPFSSQAQGAAVSPPWWLQPENHRFLLFPLRSSFSRGGISTHTSVEPSVACNASRRFCAAIIWGLWRMMIHPGASLSRLGHVQVPASAPCS